MHPAELSDEKLLAQCEVQRTRRSGPGGQHRNKVETAIVIKHVPTGLVAEANEKRSQAENKSVALYRMRLVTAVDFRSPRESETGELLQSRIRNRRLSVNTGHADFAQLLAEVLDRLHLADYEIARVAEQIKLSNSQILKFLKQHPPAFERFNAEREKRGLPRFKF